MKKLNPSTIFYIVLLCLFGMKANSQEVWTIVNANGSTGIKIIDKDGIKKWQAFDHTKTDKEEDGEDPVPGECPKPEYVKDPTKLKGGKSYWLLYRDCAENPPAGNLKTYELIFYNDASRRESWQQMSEKDIPDPKSEQNWLYWGLGGLLVLILLLFLLRRKR